MFRTILAAGMAASLFSVNAARADDAPASAPSAPAAQKDLVAPPPSEQPKTTLHLEPTALMPLGTLGRSYGPAVGGLLGFDYRVAPSTSLTGRAGYVVGLSKDTSVPGVMTISASASYLPVLVGAKQYLSAPGAGVYLSGEIGLVMSSYTASMSLTTPQASSSLSNTSASATVGAGFGVGYQLGGFDLRSGVFAADVTAFGDGMQIMSSLAYHFVEL